MLAGQQLMDPPTYSPRPPRSAFLRRLGLEKIFSGWIRCFMSGIGMIKMGDRLVLLQGDFCWGTLKKGARRTGGTHSCQVAGRAGERDSAEVPV